MSVFRWLRVVAGMTWLACAAACDGGGGSSDAGTSGGPPIVIAITAPGDGDRAETCGGCHIVLDEVSDDVRDDVLRVPDHREYLVHEQLMIARDLVAP